MNAAEASVGRSPVTTFRKRRPVLIFWIVFGVLFIVQGIATAALLVQNDDMDDTLRTVTVGLGMFLAAVGLWFAAHAWRRLRNPEDAIVIGPAGLHDRLISDQPIPWPAIRNIHVRPTARGGSVVAFDLADEARTAIHWWPRLGEPVNRFLGYSYYILVMGTDASVERLAAAILPFAPVEGHGGHEP